MNKSLLVFMILAILICGCSNNGESANQPEPKYIGYVVQQEENRILVTHYDEQSELNDAIWIRTKKNIALGQKVSIELDGGIETSYPAQASAKNIDIIKTEHPEASRLTQQEVMIRTLDHFNTIRLPFVKSIHYSEVKNVWTVVMLDGQSDVVEDMEFTVEG